MKIDVREVNGALKQRNDEVENWMLEKLEIQEEKVRSIRRSRAARIIQRQWRRTLEKIRKNKKLIKKKKRALSKKRDISKKRHRDLKK